MNFPKQGVHKQKLKICSSFQISQMSVASMHDGSTTLNNLIRKISYKFAYWIDF